MAKKNTSNKAKKNNIENNIVTVDFTEAYKELNEMINAEVIDTPLTPVTPAENKVSMLKRLLNWFKKK